MNTGPNPTESLQELVAREAAFRLQAVQDARLNFERIRELEARVQSLQDELAERNSYIHRLHLRQEQSTKERESLVGDLAEYARLVAAAEVSCEQLEKRSRRFSEAFAVVGRALKSAFSAGSLAGRVSAAPAGDFVYYLHTPPFRIYRDESATLRGWCYSKDKRSITALRVRIDDAEYNAEIGLEEPEVLRVHGPLEHAPRPGFSVTFKTPPGRHTLALEACLSNQEWRSLLVTPVWVRHGT